MITVIVIGTKAGTGQGGISIALPGYFAALQHAGVPYQFIASHEGGSQLHKLRVYLSALRQVWQSIRAANSNQHQPILYVHIGPWFSMLRKLSCVWLGKLLGAKVICQVHSLALDRYLNHTVGRWLCKLFFMQMDQVLVLTEWWRRRIEAEGVDRVSVVPNPLPERFEFIALQPRLFTEQQISNNAVRLLTMTRLVQGKGVELAINSIVFLPDYYILTIAGDGPLRVKLENMVIDLGLAERVCFLGWVTGEDRMTLFENHDIFLLPSQNDSFGMGFVEAMAFGMPIVAQNWGAIADVVANDKSGFLVEQPDAELLATALSKLESVELRRQMGVYGKQWVLQQFSIDSVAIKLDAIVYSLQDGCNK